MSTALTTTETGKLAQCEAVIERGIETFVEVGAALTEIRDSKLYRQSHPTFTSYCQQRWGMTARRAFQMIDAARVVENVNPGSHFSTELPVPPTEKHARPLARLPKAEQGDAWQEAVETAPEGRVTAAHVEKIVRERRGDIGPESNEVEAAVIPFPASVDLRNEVRNAKADVERSPWGRLSKWVVNLPEPIKISGADLTAAATDPAFDGEYWKQVSELHAFLGQILSFAPEVKHAARR